MLVPTICVIPWTEKLYIVHFNFFVITFDVCFIRLKMADINHIWGGSWTINCHVRLFYYILHNNIIVPRADVEAALLHLYLQIQRIISLFYDIVFSCMTLTAVNSRPRVVQTLTLHPCMLPCLTWIWWTGYTSKPSSARHGRPKSIKDFGKVPLVH